MRAEARRLGYSGIEAYHQGDYVAAAERLGRAYDLLPAASLGVWSARALAKSGRLVEAARRYAAVVSLRELAGEAGVQRAAQTDAVRERAQLSSLVPQLELRLSGATWDEVSVSVDGQGLARASVREPLLLNPGEHTITGYRGTQEVSVTVSLAEGARQEARLQFANPAGEQSTSSAHPLRPYAYVAWGVGAIGIGGFGVLASLASADEERFREDCAYVALTPDLLGPGICVQSTADRRKQAYERERTLAGVALITGVVGAAAGTGLWLLSDVDEASASAQRTTAGLSLAACSATALTSSMLLAISSFKEEQKLEVCRPFCGTAHLASIERRSTLALLSLGVGVLALGGATWVLLSRDSEAGAANGPVEVSLQGGPRAVLLRASGTF